MACRPPPHSKQASEQSHAQRSAAVVPSRGRSMPLATPEAVVLELMTMGQQSVAHLGDLFRSACPASPHQELAAEILRCCGRVIAALTGNGGKKRKAVEHDNTAAAAAWSPPSTPPRKRARVGAEALGLVKSGTTEDGFIWRKYGQKEINGRMHPRLYYRCAYRHQGCTATRRVQRTREEEEPAAYEIAYYGQHTCRGAAVSRQLPPAVVDFGSNAWGCGTAPAASELHLRSCWDDGEMSSPASEAAPFDEAQTVHEWRDAAAAPVEVPSATLFHASDPEMEFLDGGFDWESLINDVPLDFGAYQ